MVEDDRREVLPRLVPKPPRLLEEPKPLEP
jgi:hypothetical protein